MIIFVCLMQSHQPKQKWCINMAANSDLKLDSTSSPKCIFGENELSSDVNVYARARAKHKTI